MTTKKRLDTIRLLIDAHPALSQSPKLAAITGEIARIGHSSRVPKHSGWLLAVLHTTRVLDTSLQQLLDKKGWLGGKDKSLGAYLSVLHKRSVIQTGEFQGWDRSITRKRNKVMHAAGEMPTQIEADTMLSDMQACLTAILSRT